MFYMQEDSFNMSSVEVEQSHAMPIMFDYALSITFAVSNMNASLITFPALRSYEPAVNLISIASTLDFSALRVFLQPRPQGLLLDDFSRWRIVGRRPWHTAN